MKIPQLTTKPLPPEVLRGVDLSRKREIDVDVANVWVRLAQATSKEFNQTYGDSFDSQSPSTALRDLLQSAEVNPLSTSMTAGARAVLLKALYSPHVAGLLAIADLTPTKSLPAWLDQLTHTATIQSELQRESQQSLFAAFNFTVVDAVQGAASIWLQQEGSQTHIHVEESGHHRSVPLGSVREPVEPLVAAALRRFVQHAVIRLGDDAQPPVKA